MLQNKNVPLKLIEKMKRILFFVLLALASCSSPSPVRAVLGEDGKVHVLLSPDADIQDYGNGVYHFMYDSSLFPKVLSAFIAAHPELEVLAISGDAAKLYSQNSGYFVVFKKKTIE